eukprot:Hpha_TRINITY_DN6940_c0_g1::TRINITY_DN6940_c0_g1_i1::g.139454::m.139454
MMRAVPLLFAVVSLQAAELTETRAGLTGRVEFQPEEYLGFLGSSTTQTEHEALAAIVGGRHIRIGSFRAVHARLNHTALQVFLSNPRIEYVERDALVRTAGCTEQGPPVSWGQARVTALSPESEEALFLHDPAWGAGTDVYVLDTGIRTSHQEFTGGKAVLGANFAGGSLLDPNGHGTHLGEGWMCGCPFPTTVVAMMSSPPDSPSPPLDP